MNASLIPYAYLLVASYMVVVTMVTGANNTTTGMQDLWHHLFVEQDYNTKIRPVFEDEHITYISVDLYLRSIRSFDEVSGTLTLNAYMFIVWIDDFLTWDYSDYEGIGLARWPQDDVWRPDITLYNTVNEYKVLGHKSLLVENYYDGEVSWTPMESSCAVDMTYFPYDVQTCELQFMCWSYTDDTVSLTYDQEDIVMDEYTPNPQWDIIETSVSFSNRTLLASVDFISFKIKLQRKPQYYVVSLLLPILLLAILDIFVFALPSDGGEKSGYAVTVFLAFAVFLTIVNSTMPENSEKISIFSIYVIIQTVQSTLITIISLVSTRFAYLDESTKIPSVLAAMTRLLLCKTTCKKISTTKVNKIGNKEEDEADAGKCVEPNDSICSLDDETCTWKKVANAGDTLFFVIFTMTFVISTTVCFCITARAK